MRPHKLTMKAFGPFAKETVVDFDSMGNSIYLISGDTGSGKTTIFDGIIYALYGTASGGARSNLGTEAFHSDYAKVENHRDEMRVELEFSNANRKFTVTRRMFWGKTGDSKTASKESVLSESGNTLVHSKGKESTDEVTAKVTEILGLDADQFRRIIMLAQGEFQKFLTAKSDERGVILGKLYDNRRHLDFQMRLKSAGELLKEQDNILIESAKAQINLFVFPDDIGEDLRSTVAIDHPLLLSTISQIIRRMSEELEVLTQSLHEEAQLKEQLTQQKAKGETQNALLKNLSTKKFELDELNKSADHFAALKSKVTLTAAAEKVIPFEAAVCRAQDEWDAVLKRIQRLEAERDRLKTRIGELDTQRAETKKKNEPQIEEFQNRQLALQGILHFYDDLGVSSSRYDTVRKQYEKAAAALAAARSELARKQSRQQELEEELQRLASAGDAEVQVAERALNDAEAQKLALEEIKKTIPSILTLGKEEARSAVSLSKAQKAEASAEAEHHRLYTAFIRGQAGILAQDLRNRLQTEESVACPVCGTVHTQADALHFAGVHSDTPSGDAVDAAYNRWDTARKAKKTAEAEHSAKASALQLQKRTLLEKAEKLLPVSDWETLAAGDALATAIRENEAAFRAAQTRYERALADQTRKSSAMAEKETVGHAVEEAARTLEAAAQNEHSLGEALASAKTSVDHWKAQLADYPGKKKETEARIVSLGNQIKVLQDQIDKANEAYLKCAEDQATNKGNLESAEAEKTAKAQARKEAEEAFAVQLSRQSFSDPDEFRKALSPDGLRLNQKSIPEWITGRQKELEGYEQKRSSLRAAIQQLEESTAGMTHTDIAALTADINKISGKISGTEKLKEALTADVGRNRAVQDELQKIQKERARFGRVFAKLDPMVETANGRYAFSRYVLSGFFHRIVEQANLHLETMTDGEYCMVPKETGDGRSNIGLELKVLNTITNLERDTGSLSGGQLFEASLSLALGLSDVVQMESTSSIRIDSMFIDEGFGSLDGGKLDKSIEVLRHLSAGRRQIGIISHVARLDECLPKKIHVIAGERGSSVRIETDA